MKLLTQNSKMRKTTTASVWNFGIPAFKSVTGLVTCPAARACVSGCYARSGAYLFSNVAKAYEARLQVTLQSDFADQMQVEIDALKAKHKKLVIRIHDSGDFYSLEYVNKWFEVINSNPSVKFYAYTKRVHLFKSLKVLPDNFTLIYSYGGIDDRLIDVKKDRHSKVFETLKELKVARYIDVANDDLLALGKNKKVGLVYHGAKNYENTAWSKVGY